MQDHAVQVLSRRRTSTLLQSGMLQASDSEPPAETAQSPAPDTGCGPQAGQPQADGASVAAAPAGGGAMGELRASMNLYIRHHHCLCMPAPARPPTAIGSIVTASGPGAAESGGPMQEQLIACQQPAEVLHGGCRSSSEWHGRLGAGAGCAWPFSPCCSRTDRGLACTCRGRTEAKQKGCLKKAEACRGPEAQQQQSDGPATSESGSLPCGIGADE